MEFKSVILVFLCGIMIPESVKSQLNYTIRLAGHGATNSHGRVEVYIYSAWRTICDDHFLQNEANVVCRQLNFTLGGRPLNASVFGPGSGGIWSFDCSKSSNANHIRSCMPTSITASNNCNHTEDAGVECYVNHTNGDIRLIGQSFRSGFVEIYYNNSWSAICNDMWSVNNAKVVCAALGYNDTSKALAGSPIGITNVSWPVVSKTFAMNNVDCAGSENTLMNCTFRRQNTCNTTNQYKYAKVTCVDLPNNIKIVPVPDLKCDKNLINASFSRLKNPYLREQDITLSHNVSCKMMKNTQPNYVTVSFGMDDCGTKNTTNSTHITFSNDLQYTKVYHIPHNQNPPLHPGLVYSYSIHLQCHYDRRVNASRCMEPLTEIVTPSGQGHFQMIMIFYRNNTFITPVPSYPVQIKIKEWLSVSLTLQTTKQGFKLVVHNCTATPNQSRNHPVRQPLFNNKCPVDPTLSFYPFNTTTFGFRYRTFKFIHYEYVCIHCDAIVCLTTETTGQCDRSCGTGGFGRRKRHVTEPTISGSDKRRKRQVANDIIPDRYIRITSPLIRILSDDDKEETPTDVIVSHDIIDNPIETFNQSAMLKYHMTLLLFLFIIFCEFM